LNLRESAKSADSTEEKFMKRMWNTEGMSWIRRFRRWTQIF